MSLVSVNKLLFDNLWNTIQVESAALDTSIMQMNFLCYHYSSYKESHRRDALLCEDVCIDHTWPATCTITEWRGGGGGGGGGGVGAAQPKAIHQSTPEAS